MAAHKPPKMWSLYTSALAKGKSTTQVAIMNTSTNFMVTAFLGLAVFSEALPPLWWAGATMLVAGNVILGRDAAAPDAEEDRSSPRTEGEGGAEARGLLEEDDEDE